MGKRESPAQKCKTKGEWFVRWKRLKQIIMEEVGETARSGKQKEWKNERTPAKE